MRLHWRVKCRHALVAGSCILQGRRKDAMMRSRPGPGGLRCVCATNAYLHACGPPRQMYLLSLLTVDTTLFMACAVGAALVLGVSPAAATPTVTRHTLFRSGPSSSGLPAPISEIDHEVLLQAGSRQTPARFQPGSSQASGRRNGKPGLGLRAAD